jgi:hypothetical protein
MARLVTISAIAGFFITVALLVALAFYTTALRKTLAECQAAHLALGNDNARCGNAMGALQNKLSASAAELLREQRKIGSLEARLEAAGAPRICAGTPFGLAG